MLYFKKNHFNYEDKAKIETALRKYAIKRNSILYLELSPFEVGTDKLFFEYENKKALYFTRIRSSFELFLPKIIFSLSKNETDLYYRIRLSAFGLFLFLFFSLALTLDLLLIIQGKVPNQHYLNLLIIFLSFLTLIWFELKNTCSKIEKAVME